MSQFCESAQIEHRATFSSTRRVRYLLLQPTRMKPTCFITVFAVAAKFAPGYAQAGSSDQIFFGVDLTGCQSASYPNAAAAEDDFLSNLLPGVETETFEGFANNAGSPLTLGFDAGGPLTATLTSVGEADASFSNQKYSTR